MKLEEGQTIISNGSQTMFYFEKFMDVLTENNHEIRVDQMGNIIFERNLFTGENVMKFMYDILNNEPMITCGKTYQVISVERDEDDEISYIELYDQQDDKIITTFSIIEDLFELKTENDK
jgi:hypothetical protein